MLYVRDLLALGTYTLKQVAEITGLGKNTVKAIALKRLKELYTIDGTQLIKPEKRQKPAVMKETSHSLTPTQCIPAPVF